jgi:NitT/TauT family transport system permease protein
MKRYTIIGPILIVSLWALIAWFRLVDPFFLPGPLMTMEKLGELLWNGSIIPDLFATLIRVAASFLIAVTVGLPLGLWLGSSEKKYRSIEFVIDFFRSTPATALFPLFLLLFGISDISKIAVAGFSSTIIVIFNTAYGVMNANKSRLRVVQSMGATKMQIFRLVLFWESLPQTFIGLRNAVSMSLVVIVASEMFIGTTSGLGRRIIDSQVTYEIPTMYATIILTGIVGFLLNFLFLLIEKRVIHWTGK